MLTFATEFPIRPLVTRESFLAEVIAWLRGTEYSTVLNRDAVRELEASNVHLMGTSGEELRLLEFDGSSGLQAIGFRHDNPDGDGRLWRTDCVVRRGFINGTYDLLRIRTQCSAYRPGALLEVPRKPYILKTIINAGWGGRDKHLEISDQPHWLSPGAQEIDRARRITLGEATEYLPVVYVSCGDVDARLLNDEQIKRLAYRLGGVAHVVVEPDRAFSFSVRDATDGRNVYGGTLGVISPGRGVVRRYRLGWQLQRPSDVAAAAERSAIYERSLLPSKGWDWVDLLEHASRANRRAGEGVKNTDLSDRETYFKEKISELENKIFSLESNSNIQTDSVRSIDSEDLSLERVFGGFPEIWDGEFFDRFRVAACIALNEADRIGLDDRTRAVLDVFLKRTSQSPALRELRKDLERATGNGNRMASDVSRLLSRHCYKEKSDNKHVRLEPVDGYVGIGSITLAKTPGDHRTGRNTRTQIERAMGITTIIGFCQNS